MDRRKAFLALGGLVLLLGAVFLASQSPPQKKADFEAIAQRLVNQCAAIREGEMVYVGGGTEDFELLEDIAVNVRKAGGHALISVGSDRLDRRMWTDVPQRYDQQSREPWVKFAGLFAAAIYVSYSENEALLADIPAERLEASAKANAPVNDVLRKNNVRQIFLGNALYPTDQLAARYGLTKDELARVFWDCVNVDYAALQKTGEAIKSRLIAGKELRITNPNGTDLRFRVEGRPVIVSDGVITDDEKKKGFAACQIYLPAGEVYAVPVSGTAEGKVVSDRSFLEGQEISGLTWTFKAGKLVSMSAASGLDRLKAYYDASGPGKDDFAFIDIGVNPKLAGGAAGKILNYVRAGILTVGIGNNVWAGGENSVPFSYDVHLPGCTLTVDGKALIENGKIIL
jgi:leucyl aminopeptidase (aminopeptidase T)